ncbi:hypothetical protein BDK61_3475 [Haloarcula quadrata]|uniref:Uncharacterized protein n=1 Tax=Haloarcula quadrata TaxID=182779 RepID=A0A495R9X3_9EURY|nr:hypothetical protein [Haloarcula sp. Atlit-7R]RKS84075.1 hypothetical protein BDK61_3475 [Haloarcula quadrata]
MTTTLQVTISMMPETYDSLEDSKPDDLTMDAYIRSLLRKEAGNPLDD